MGGIVGFVDKREALSREDQERLLLKMRETIRHRGHDGQGAYIDDGVAVAHTRLSILDVTAAGHQPMLTEDGEFVLSFNGEIYNHAEFRSELLKKYRFKSQSDTESLLYAFKEWDETCLGLCRGMFAFSILDKKKRDLFLAVDRFGIKPLYYIDTPDWFAWSSEIKSLLLLPGFVPKFRKAVLHEYLLFRSVAGPETLIEGIYKILPAHSLRYSIATGAVEQKKYWSRGEATNATAPPGSSEDAIRNLLTRSVREHLLADVPVGIQLSGGVDSSLIGALVRREIPATQELHSFSIGSPDPRWNEFEYSRLASHVLKTNHHELIFTEEDFCKNLPIATYHYDEPINHSHSVPMMLLAEEAKKHVKVLLSGEGADEIFGGYSRYLMLAQDRDLTDEMILYSNAFVPQNDARAATGNTLDLELSARRALLGDSSDQHRKLAEYDIETYLPPLLLRQDKMGMRSSLENRVPFLDADLVCAALALPQEEKYSSTESKILLKKIASDFLPPEIVYRKKVGFGQPIEAWLRNESGLGAYLVFFTHPNPPRDFFDYAAIQEMIMRHREKKGNYTAILWALINLELWTRIFIDGKDPHAIF